MKVRKTYIAAAAAFAAAFCFFLTAYPCHLIRREQMTLFLYDWSSIFRTYWRPGGPAHLAGDFLTQFFHYPAAGPAIVALLLTAIGAVSFRICRRFLGEWPSLATAAALYLWSGLRECGSWFETGYTVAVPGYLLLALAALQFKGPARKAAASVVLAAAGVLLLGSPVSRSGGAVWNFPDFKEEKVIALDVEASLGHWKKVRELAGKEDLRVSEATFYYNLANALEGKMAERLMNHSQNYAEGLFRPVNSEVSEFTVTASGEVWFRLGDMTLAEQSAIVGMTFSPRHSGPRYLVRLAQINRITGDDGAAMKYLTMLSRTLTYRRWALKMMPGSGDEGVERWLAHARRDLAENDFVHGNSDPRPVLRNLLAANPANGMAREYLLCTDLIVFDLESFMRDYIPVADPPAIYQEAILIWMAQHGRFGTAEARALGVSGRTISAFEEFGNNPAAAPRSYWHYYQTEMLKGGEKE